MDDMAQLDLLDDPCRLRPCPARCPLCGRPARREDVAATARKTCRDLWGAVEDKLGDAPWAIGERYGVADPYLLVYWTWGRGPVLAFDMVHDFPRWTQHARRLAGRPAVQRAFASEGLALPA